uniref:Putative retroelement protein n=1 Tax=Coprinellus disseminatus TaxID=71703 RepID=Q1WMU5_COPDI|nr:putative retroelement protein [Coprinellus disseminatus]
MAPRERSILVGKRVRSRSASPALGGHLQRPSQENLSKKPKLSSRITGRGRSPDPKQSVNCSSSLTSPVPRQTSTLVVHPSNNSAPTSKRKRNAKRRQAKGVAESPKLDSSGIWVLEEARGKVELLSRISSPTWDDLFESDPMPTMRTTTSTTSQSLEESELDWIDDISLGISVRTPDRLSPLIPEESKIEDYSSSSPSTPHPSSPTSDLVVRLPHSPPQNGPTSSRAFLSTSTTSSQASTMSTLLNRALLAWDSVRLPLTPPSPPRPSTQPPIGLPHGTPRPVPTSSSSPTVERSLKPTENISCSCLLPRSPPQPTRSSSTTRPSETSSLVDNDTRSPTLVPTPTSRKQSSHRTASKPKVTAAAVAERRARVLGARVEGTLSVSGSTGPVVATGRTASANTSTSASRAAERGMVTAHVKVEEAKKRSWVQRFLRWNCWGLPVPVSGSEWSITAKPLPSPPESVLNDAVAMSTISDNPHLFALPSPMNVERLRDLSSTHPNQAFVLSVIEGFQNGYWPLANPPADAPHIVNHSNPSPTDPVHASFLLEQRDIELEKGRYSEGFPELLPGMRAMPLRVVPKDGGSALRLVVNHSKEPHSLNSMVDRTLMPKVPLDNMHSLGEHILTIREEHPGEELVLWKSDVSEAYRLLPVHFFWQLMQAEWIAGLFYLNHCIVFGGRASQYMFIAFMSMVSWIAVHIRGIRFLCSFSDDHFGVALKRDTTWYEPFAALLPTPQVKLLTLWDDLGIPHKRKKQLSGSPLVIIGILVDVDLFTLTLPKESITDLLDELASWCDPKGKIARRGVPLQRWQQLAGWLNWSFNVFPLLRPCLSNVYAKMRGKSSSGGVFRPNNAIRMDLGWVMAYIKQSTGVHILSSLHWLPSEADYTIYCDASLKGMGFWVVNENLGFYSPTVDTQGEDFIFFHESLCVLSAIIWLDEHECLPQRLTIYTDNTNTVDMFNTLSASPRMNPILKAACDIALTGLLDFKVLYVPGCDNHVADALSRFDVPRALVFAPHLRVSTFTPPRITLGQAL